MPADSPPAAPSPLTIKLMEIADGYRATATCGNPAKAWQEATGKVELLLAPVREAIQMGYQHLEPGWIGVDMKLIEAMRSLSPQPPEAKP